MLLTLTLLSGLLTASAPDSVTGAWLVKNEVSGVTWEEICTIKQTASALTGSCVNQEGTKYDVSGEVKEGKVTFQHAGFYEGQDLVIKFTVDEASPKALKGTIHVTPLEANGSFTAEPAPPKP